MRLRGRNGDVIMAPNGWLDATELQTLLSEAENKLKAAEDRLVESDRVRKRAEAVVRDWPSVRAAIGFSFAHEVRGFSELVSYLGQAVRNQDSTVPPPSRPRAPQNDADYLNEVLIEMLAMVEQFLDKPELVGDLATKLHTVLKEAIEPEEFTQVDAPKTPFQGSPALYPAGYQYNNKGVSIRRLIAEDDGPDYSERMVPRLDPDSPPKATNQVVVERPIPDLCGCGGTCLWCKESATRKDPDALAARLARIESALGLDTAF